MPVSSHTNAWPTARLTVDRLGVRCIADLFRLNEDELTVLASDVQQDLRSLGRQEAYERAFREAAALPATAFRFLRDVRPLTLLLPPAVQVAAARRGMRLDDALSAEHADVAFKQIEPAARPRLGWIASGPPYRDYYEDFYECIDEMQTGVYQADAKIMAATGGAMLTQLPQALYECIWWSNHLAKLPASLYALASELSLQQIAVRYVWAQDIDTPEVSSRLKLAGTLEFLSDEIPETELGDARRLLVRLIEERRFAGARRLMARLPWRDWVETGEESDEEAWINERWSGWQSALQLRLDVEGGRDPGDALLDTESLLTPDVDRVVSSQNGVELYAREQVAYVRGYATALQRHGLAGLEIVAKLDDLKRGQVSQSRVQFEAFMRLDERLQSVQETVRGWHEYLADSLDDLQAAAGIEAAWDKVGPAIIKEWQAASSKHESQVLAERAIAVAGGPEAWDRLVPDSQRDVKAILIVNDMEREALRPALILACLVVLERELRAALLRLRPAQDVDKKALDRLLSDAVVVPELIEPVRVAREAPDLGSLRNRLAHGLPAQVTDEMVESVRGRVVGDEDRPGLLRILAQLANYPS